jgi:hypothetical protein
MTSPTATLPPLAPKRRSTMTSTSTSVCPESAASGASPTPRKGSSSGSPCHRAAPTAPASSCLGVVPTHRRHGYVDNLLAEITRHADHGALRITGTTGTTKAPVVGAFTRGGYICTGVRMAPSAVWRCAPHGAVRHGLNSDGHRPADRWSTGRTSRRQRAGASLVARPQRDLKVRPAGHPIRTGGSPAD